MELGLRPRESNGVMRWTCHALLLHLFWGWQLVVACAMGVGLMGALVMSRGSWDDELRPDNRWLWLFFVLTAFLVVSILAEVCLFANSHLEVNKWLALQAVKSVYIATAFGVYVGAYHLDAVWSRSKEAVHTPKEAVLTVGVVAGYWAPWFPTLGCALLIRVQDGKQKGKETLPTVVDERRPLLPRRVTPKVRFAVDRSR